MDPRDPRRIAYEQRQWLRHDWHRFCTPADARRMGLVHPDTRKAERRRAWEAEAAAARADAQFKADQAEVLRLRLRMADLRFERALIALRRKYTPDQPRVPAGNSDGGRWTSGGISPRQPRIRFAGDPPTPLRRIHPDSTYESDPEAKRSLEYWRQQPTDRIVDSLRRGEGEPLKAYPDGRIANGNTRIKVLQERGYDINSLPREMYRPTPSGRGRPGGGGGLPGGGGGGFPPLLLPPQF